MPQTQVRVVGSGFSTFLYNNQSLAWLESITDSGQTVKGGGGGFEVDPAAWANYAAESSRAEC